MFKTNTLKSIIIIVMTCLIILMGYVSLKRSFSISQEDITTKELSTHVNLMHKHIQTTVQAATAQYLMGVGQELLVSGDFNPKDLTSLNLRRMQLSLSHLKTIGFNTLQIISLQAAPHELMAITMMPDASYSLSDLSADANLQMMIQNPSGFIKQEHTGENEIQAYVMMPKLDLGIVITAPVLPLDHPQIHPLLKSLFETHYTSDITYSLIKNDQVLVYDAIYPDYQIKDITDPKILGAFTTLIDSASHSPLKVFDHYYMKQSLDQTHTLVGTALPVLEGLSLGRAYTASLLRFAVVAILLLAIALMYILSTKRNVHLQETNRTLSEKVDERTMELMISNRYQEHTLKEAEHAKDLLAAKNEKLMTSLYQLQAAQEQLVEAEKLTSLGTLVAGVAHEINTPIGNAITASSFIAKLYEDIQKTFTENTLTKQAFEHFLSDYQEAGHIVQDNLFRASELITSFKQIAVDQMEDVKISFNMRAYIDKVLLSMKHEWKQTPHEINITCDPDLEIYGPPGAYAQILSNLIMNSLKHGLEFSLKGTMTLDITTNDSHLTIIYRDDGVGMTDHSVKHIFDPFYTTKRGKGGSGLGMHIVYNLITQKLKGTITVTSKRNEGTSFTIKIPLRG